MELTTPRRSLFRANASAFGGRMHRPRPLVIVSEACSSLTVSGGRAESRVGTRHFKPYLTVGAARTVAEGRFDDANAARALTLRRDEGDQSTLGTKSAATAVTERVVVLRRHVVREMRATLHASRATAEAELDVRIGRDTAVKGWTIDGFPLTVDLDFETFDRLTTYSAFAGAGAPRCAEGPPRDGVRRPLLTTIVRSIRWTRTAHPNATIDGHVVTVPDFGRIIVGELLVSGDARRLTLMRLVLGSPDGGDVDFNEVETDGSSYPPVG